jgi:hypothetical protein
MRAVTLGAALVYSYAISASTKVSFDYQFVVNPAYNTDRGPVTSLPGDFIGNSRTAGIPRPAGMLFGIML